MTKILEEFEEKIKRKAILFNIGGFRPPEDPLNSWFGKVLFCREGESWPMQDGEPMLALAQINLTVLPFKPHRMDDIEFITVFIGSNQLPNDDKNGCNWEIRTYNDVSKLVMLDQVESKSHIKAFPMSYEVVEDDFPCWEDIAWECPEEMDEKYHDMFENISGFKLGGWPTLIQSEINWAPWNKHNAVPEYVFQIDSEAKGNWSWGDGGVGYFGRGTAEGKENEWAISWQCY